MKKMREVNYIFYMILMYSFSCLYGIFYKNKIADILKFQNINLGYLGIFIILVISYLFLFIKHNKTMEDVIKFITKILISMTLILMGVNYPKQWLMGLTVYTIIMLIILFIPRKKVKESSKLELYPSRKNLMEVLSHALGEYSLIALDGTWGSGKTTFMDIAMREKREKYYYIPINVMLFENRNSLKTEFLNQLKGIFKEEGIFQGSLMDFDYYLDGVSNDWIKVFKNIIFSKSKSFKEANEKLKNEIGKIDKKIVVGVDNLERIYGESEPEWKQILGFIHELQELGIKIVVMANLGEMLGDKSQEIKLKLNGLIEGNKDYLKEIKIEQDKNDNYDYFDKFYEFKLQLNEVTSDEIIDEIEVKENTVDKKWLKNQIKELTSKINKRFENLGADQSDKEKLTEKISEYKDLHWRYLNEIKNPRKIEKLIKDIQIKQEKIRNIFNFIGEKDYKKLIFRTSLYETIFFDCLMEYNQKTKIVGKFGREVGMDRFIENPFSKNDFFRAFGYEEFQDERPINRLLYYDSKEDLIIEEMKKLILTGKITLSTIDKSLKDLEVYSSSLDPDFDQKTTKEAYKIIVSKLIELEKTDEKEINKIIKENEENICRLNYLTYPDNLGIFESIKYKFNNEIIYMMYRDLEDILRPGRSRSHNELRDILNTIDVYYYFEKENYIKIREMSRDVNLNEIKKLIEKIKQKEDILKIRKEKEVSSISKDENIKYDMVLNFLMIIKNNMEKQEITIVEELNLGNWGEYNFKQKEELLNVLENSFENIKELSRDNSDFTLFTKVKEESDLLKSIIEKEENKTIILKLAYLIKTIEYRLVEFEIFKKVNDINMEVGNGEKKV